MPLERRRVHYSGRVQGVGFRFTTEHLAQTFEVSGYVRNLSDGRVEVVAEGETNELQLFLDSIQHALGDKIHAVETEGLPAIEPKLQGFVIRY